MNAILGIGIEGFGLAEFGNLLSRLGDRGLGIDVGIAVRLPIESDRVEVRRSSMGELTAMLAEVEVLATEARAWKIITGEDHELERERIASIYRTIEQTAGPARLLDAATARGSAGVGASGSIEVVEAASALANSRPDAVLGLLGPRSTAGLGGA